MDKFLDRYGASFGYFVTFDGVKYLVKTDANCASYFVPVTRESVTDLCFENEYEQEVL